jgi:hypothetical protein
MITWNLSSNLLLHHHNVHETLYKDSKEANPNK